MRFSKFPYLIQPNLHFRIFKLRILRPKKLYETLEKTCITSSKSASSFCLRKRELSDLKVAGEYCWVITQALELGRGVGGCRAAACQVPVCWSLYFSWTVKYTRSHTHTHIYIYIYIYMIIQGDSGERTIFWEVVVSVVMKKRSYERVSSSEYLPRESCLNLQIQTYQRTVNGNHERQVTYVNSTLILNYCLNDRLVQFT